VTHPDNNPLAVIASDVPQLKRQDAIELLLQHYGLAVVKAESLVSERDQNFEVRTADGLKLVFKIANAAEDPQVTDFQIKALQHIERYQSEHGKRFNAPRIVPTLAGELQITVRSGDVSHICRLVSYVEGVPLGDDVPGPGFSRNAGIYLAEIGRALRDFRHDASDHNLLWDMKRALDLRELQRFITDPALRKQVARCLDDFEEHALPRFGNLRWQVIHNDLNPDNILVDAPQGSKVVGVIDFGDMLSSPLIVDVAVAVSYLRSRNGNPLSRVANFIAGYHSVTPLRRDETDLLYDLIRTRLAATTSIRFWRISERSPDDPYLKKILQENSAERFLSRLDELPRESVQSIFREACGNGGS